MSQVPLDIPDGWHPGVLFGPLPIRRQPKPRMQSSLRDRVVRRHTPPWADRSAIRRLYAEARRLTRSTGVRHSVDHVIPLNHPAVCGMHVETNLQVVPLADNMKRGNRWWPGMPHEQVPLL